MKSIFREYDIRGIFEKELNRQSVTNIGYRLAQETKKRVQGAQYIAVGYDARTHSPTLLSWLASGINHAGLQVLDMGLVPTPVNYFSNYCEFEGKRSDASIMITGSHNPPEYNGFKITIDKQPFFGEDIYALGALIDSDMKQLPDNDKTIAVDAKQRYIDYIVEQFAHLKLQDQSFVFDCGNGAAGVVLDAILTRLNISAEVLYEDPDGTFPNHHPDPSDAKNLLDIKEELSSGEYALGFAYDGDADRIAVLSQKYNFKGDMLAVMFAKNIKDPVVVGEVKCSQVMYDAINAIGSAHMYKTGHSNLKVKIKELDASLAAEVSGHLFFNDRYFGFDDAIYATMRTLELVDAGFDLDSEYEALPSVYVTDEINIETTEEKKFDIIEGLKQKLQHPPEGFPPLKEVVAVDGVRVIFEQGWGLVRASNTTPKLVTRFEAKSRQAAKAYQKALMDLLQDLL
ncbi:MAG: phosphomannomutase/phosphoglucomutase [Campylobacterota bacterium]